MKKFPIVLMLLSAIALSFTACSGDTAASTPPAPTQAGASENIAEAPSVDEETAESGETVAEPDDSFASDLRQLVTEAFMGVADDEETTIYLGLSETYGVLAFMSGDVSESLSYVGPLEMGEGQISIADETSGTITLGVEQVENGYILELEGFGSFKVAMVEMDQLIEALEYINSATTPQ